MQLHSASELLLEVEEEGKIKKKNEEGGNSSDLVTRVQKKKQKKVRKSGETLRKHKPSFFVGLNASVHACQTQVCTENRFSSLSTVRKQGLTLKCE